MHNPYALFNFVLQEKSVPFKNSLLVVKYLNGQIMFDETKKYANNGHFFFQKGNKLADVSKGVPELPGVYYILRLARGRVDLVYIGKSGTISQNGKENEQLLRDKINYQQEGITRQSFFDKKMVEEKIDALDIYWFVTIDESNSDLPGYVEGLLMRRYFELNAQLPIWNKKY